MPLQLPDRMPPAAGMVARIAPGAPVAVSPTALALALAIPRRHSNRWPFVDLVLSRSVRADLARAARAEGAVLRVPGHRVRRNLLGLVRTAEDQWRANPAYREELARWTLDRPERRDGVPPEAVGPLVIDDHLPLRDLGLAAHRPRRKAATFERSSTIAVLYAGDSPERWLRAGQALQRVLLTATVHGVSATLMTQPLEIPQLREMLRDPYTGQPAQAIIRFGYRRRPAAAAPRRPLVEFLR